MTSSISKIAQKIKSILDKYNISLKSNYPNITVIEHPGDSVVIINAKGVTITIGENIEISSDKMIVADKITLTTSITKETEPILMSADFLKDLSVCVTPQPGAPLFPTMNAKLASGAYTNPSIIISKI